MKKADFIIIAAITGTLVISIFAFQPATEASNNAMPNATPSPRKIRKLPKQTIEVENDETHLKTKVKTRKPGYKEGGVNDATTRKSRRKRRN